MKTKKFFLIVALFSFILSFGNEYKIQINTKGIENGTEIILQLSGENYQPQKISSTNIVNNTAVFKGVATQTYQIAFVQVANFGSIPFILEKGIITIQIDLDLDKKIKSVIGGSEQNNMFQLFNERAQAGLKKISDFQNENNATLQKAFTEKDTATSNNLVRKFNDLQKEVNNNSSDFIKNYSNSFISLLLAENLLASGQLNINEAKLLFEKFNDSLKKTKEGLRLKAELFDKKSTEINDIAPEFSGPNPDGKIISLKESLGKVTIIDFWASWCAPCRAENPHVVALYKEYHSKGLNIIGISLDKDEMKWKEAITKDGLTWNHISNLKFWEDPIAKMYGIKSIPATLILDESGKIIAKNLRGEALKEKIKELLEQK